MNKTKCTALVPLSLPKENIRGDMQKKYRREGSPHILYIRLYLLFFFFGACIFASGRWNADVISQTALSYIIVDNADFPSFCVSSVPLILSAFVVYASGFTVYAPLLSVVYSAALFLLSGMFACSVIFAFGFSLEVLAVLLILGANCGLSAFFCSVAFGISKIATKGIERLSISDGLLYTLFYLATVWMWYISQKGVFALTT